MMTRSYPCKFGPYVLAGPLGEGGTGDVCLGLQGRRGLEKVLVIKRLWKTEGPRGDIEARFRREADLARRLTHGAVAQILAVGEVEGELYIAEELVDGTDLAEVPLGTISLPMAVHIAREVARALAYVHAFEGLGLVHRDVAPANIRLSYTGEVKLIDFGLATSPKYAGLTRPGVVLGRKLYNAPELRRGDRGDQRADIYALGVVLWEMLTKRRYLDEMIRAGKANGGDRGVLPPSRLNPEVDPALDQVVTTAMAERPEDRYGSANELRAALGAFLPQRFDGELEIKQVLERLEETPRQRRVMATLLAAGRELLEDEPQPTGTEPADVVPVSASADVSAGSTLTEQTGRVLPWVRRVGFGVGLGVAILGGLTLYRWSIEDDLPMPAVEKPREAAVATNPANVRAAAPAPQVTALVPSATRLKLGAGSGPESRQREGRVLSRKDHSAPATLRVAETRTAAELLTLAREKLEEQHDFVGAEEFARRAVAANGGAEAYELLGIVLLGRKKYADAETAFERSLEIAPGNPAVTERLRAAQELRIDQTF